MNTYKYLSILKFLDLCLKAALMYWYDDFTKVPFGNVRNAARYQAARVALMEHPEVKRTLVIAWAEVLL